MYAGSRCCVDCPEVPCIAVFVALLLLLFVSLVVVLYLFLLQHVILAMSLHQLWMAVRPVGLFVFA